MDRCFRIGHFRGIWNVGDQRTLVFFSPGQKTGQHVVLTWGPFQSAVGNECLPDLSGQVSVTVRGKPVVHYDYAVYFRDGQNRIVSRIPVQVSIAAEHEIYVFPVHAPLLGASYITVAHTGTAPHHPSRQASCPAPAEPKPDQPLCTCLLTRISASPVKNRSPVTSPSLVSVPIQSLHFPQYAKKSVACHLTIPGIDISFD